MKKLWSMLLLLAIIGVALMTVGFFSGADLTLYVDRSGLHMGNDERHQEKQMNIDKFTNIEIDVAAADIEIIPSNTYGLEINGGNSAPITYTYERENLKINQNYQQSWRIFSMNFDNAYDSIKIYLPSDKKLDGVNIKTLSGKINIDELNCRRLNLKLASGNTDIQDVTANEISVNSASGHVTISRAKADQFDFVLTSGDLNAMDIHSNNLSTHMTSGKAVLDGQFKGHNSINIISGSVNLRVDGAESDYNRSISTVSGDVYINGVKNSANIHDNSTKNDLNINMTSGNVNIDFTR